MSTLDTTAHSTHHLLRLRRTLTPDDPRRLELRNEAIAQNLALSRRLAQRYAGRGADLDDLHQVAAYGLIKAVDGYDPERGVPFVAYAYPYILGALKRHFRDTAWGMHVPRSVQDLNQRVTVAIADLGHRQARTPSRHEIAEHLDVTVAEVQRAAGAANALRLTSLNGPHHGYDGGELVDAIGHVDVRIDHIDARISVEPLLAGLAPRERRILALRFDSEMTQAAIAAHLGISQMHVSRLLKQSLATLRTALSVPADSPGQRGGTVDVRDPVTTYGAVSATSKPGWSVVPSIPIGRSDVSEKPTVARTYCTPPSPRRT
jgi:RNA polymerase sigma-B factor